MYNFLQGARNPKIESSFFVQSLRCFLWLVSHPKFQLLLTGFSFSVHFCGVSASFDCACLSQTHPNTCTNMYIQVPPHKLPLTIPNVCIQTQNVAAAQMTTLPSLLTICVQDSCFGCCSHLFQEGTWFSFHLGSEAG